jgi:methylglutamate dehydrogenase subunit B
MLLIPCLCCGLRDESEFTFGGVAVSLPAMDRSTGLAEWHKAVHLHDAGSEPVAELWFHHGGCETWVSLTRHSKTHVFIKEAGP